MNKLKWKKCKDNIQPSMEYRLSGSKGSSYIAEYENYSFKIEELGAEAKNYLTVIITNPNWSIPFATLCDTIEIAKECCEYSLNEYIKNPEKYIKISKEAIKCTFQLG